jgi:hypothetical protein
MSTPYGSSDTASSVATSLINAINTNCNGTCVSPVTAAPSGSTGIQLTTKASGTGSNYTVTTGHSWNTSAFAQASFSVCVGTSINPCAQSGALSGGYGPGGPLTASTFYQYDALDNLVRVDQKNNDSTSTDWRTRTFSYDSLSRLRCAANPEIAIATCPSPDPVPDNVAYTQGTMASPQAAARRL